MRFGENIPEWPQKLEFSVGPRALDITVLGNLIASWHYGSLLIVLLFSIKTCTYPIKVFQSFALITGEMSHSFPWKQIFGGNKVVVFPLEGVLKGTAFPTSCLFLLFTSTDGCFIILSGEWAGTPLCVWTASQLPIQFWSTCAQLLVQERCPCHQAQACSVSFFQLQQARISQRWGCVWARGSSWLRHPTFSNGWRQRQHF